MRKSHYVNGYMHLCSVVFYFSIICQDICAYDVVLADVFRFLLLYLFLLE